MDDDEKKTIEKKFKEVKKRATLRSFLNKDEINDKGRELRKLEAKKEKTAEDEKRIRQIRKESERLSRQQQEVQQMVNRASLGEKILKCYFAYKMASLFCHAFLGYHNDSGIGGGIGGALASKWDNEIEEKLENGEIDINTARADQIEQVRDQFDKINEDAKTLGISQDDVFDQQDKDKLTELAEISRDGNNPQQAELYASKCEELGLDKRDALQAIEQDNAIEAPKQKKEITYEMER